MSDAIVARVARELGVRACRVAATVRLLDAGATVPFIARYRKELTGGLDDVQLRELASRLAYLRELDERRAAVIAAIEVDGRLTPELRTALLAADSKQRVEDLYLPYRRKRRTRGELAREAGLEPLADSLLRTPTLDPAIEATRYLAPQHGVADAEAALRGARYLLAERFAENAELIAELRELAWREGFLASAVVAGAQVRGAKFSDYFDGREPIRRIPSHRALALLRGRREGVLRLRFGLPDDLDTEPGTAASAAPGAGERHIAGRFGIRHEGRAADDWLAGVVRFTWRVKLLTRLETDLTGRLREAAEAEAIAVFANNLKDLLLAAPAGARPVLAIDPGLRTGCKVAVVDATGKVVATTTIHPHAPHRRDEEALASLARLIRRHGVRLVAIGNGTGSRETERLVAALRGRDGMASVTSVTVSEAGASVYSASEAASAELPELDVTLRGAVSIARRVQDPLAELVKIDPAAIGVGQYQHDVPQGELARALDAVVEDGVSAVGVDLNTASSALLARVAGVSRRLAERIVAHRNEYGAFRRRRDLLSVPRFGARAFEQAAGFLRISGGDDPLDASAVHPEAYPVVERIMRHCGRDIGSLIGDQALLRRLDPCAFTDGRFGKPTVADILRELEKPGRDPRPEFRTARFRDDVESLSDLRAGMWLEGVVTNVTGFGAFVDIGVHQDGLVHISALAERFVRDPREVCRPGDLVRVQVLEVEHERRRIALSMRAAGGRRAPAGAVAGAGRTSGGGRGDND